MSESRPRLRPDVRLVEQVLHGERNFVVKVPESQKYFRLRPAEAQVLTEFDGLRSPADIARDLAERGLAVSAAAVERFAATCARLGLMERTLMERSVLQLERLRAERRRHRSLFRGELMRMRWSMGDPDRLITKLLPYLRWCFTPTFIAASSIIMVVYFLIIVAGWSTFSTSVVSLATLQGVTPGQIAILWLISFLVYGVHEFAHGFTCKYFGGEVHEVGFMLIYFEPAFYCNVNDAWGFRDRAARLWVTAAGSWAQMVVASVAAIVWWAVRTDTTIAEIAFDVMLVGGIFPVLANANPLIPLDGYFALSDWLEIPNLRQRAAGHVGWWVRRHLLGLEVPEPAATVRERRIFLLYGALAGLYILGGLVLVAAWILYVGWSHWGVTGALLAAAVVVAVSRKTVGSWGRTVWDGVRMHGRRLRGLMARRRLGRRALGGFVAVVAIAAVVPWPITVSGPFRAASIRTVSVVVPRTGVVTEVLVREGERVSPGAALLRLRDPAAVHDVEVGRREMDSLVSEAAAARASGDAAEAARLDAATAASSARVEAASRRVSALTVRAFEGGEVVTPRPESLLGRRLVADESALTLADPDSVELRVSLNGPGASDVRLGAPVRAVSYADVTAPVSAPVASVGALGAAFAGAHGAAVRVRVPRTAAWRSGVQGEAYVVLRRSTVLGALAWSVRSVMRPGLFL